MSMSMSNIWESGWNIRSPKLKRDFKKRVVNSNSLFFCRCYCERSVVIHNLQQGFGLPRYARNDNFAPSLRAMRVVVRDVQ